MASGQTEEVAAAACCADFDGAATIFVAYFRAWHMHVAVAQSCRALSISLSLALLSSFSLSLFSN